MRARTLALVTVALAALAAVGQAAPPAAPKAAAAKAAQAHGSAMGLYEAWYAAADKVFGKEAAAAAAADHARPKALVPVGASGGTLTVSRVNQSATILDGVWYEVTWSVNATAVLPSDRLAVVWEPPAGTPDNDAVTRRDPLQFAFVSALAPDTYKTAGTGTAVVWLPPQRQAVRFVYVRQGPFNLWAGASSVVHATAPPPAPNTPVAVKVTGGLGGGGAADAASLAASPTAVAITWQTRDVMVGGHVRWGPAGGPLNFTAPAVSGDGTPGTAGAGAVFDASKDYCAGVGKPATREGAPWDFESLGVVNRATLTGLAPGATYEYEVVAGAAAGGGGGADDGSATTVAGQFSTAPAAEAFGDATRLVVLADGGTSLPSPDGAWDQADGNLFTLYKTLFPAVLMTPGTAAYALFQGALALFGGQSIQPAAGSVTDAVTARVAAGAAEGKPYHGVVFTGDISYARGEATQWDVFGARWWRALSAAPLLSAAGNHESAGPPIPDPLIATSTLDDGGECGQGAARLLGAPTPSGPDQWWYASRNGPLTILHLNSDQSLAAGSPQHAWLEATLAAVDRTATPWLAVALHRPMYSDDPTAGQQGPTAQIVDGIERLLVSHSVDLVLSGHLHTYQRSCPVAKGNCFGRAGLCTGVALDPIAAEKCRAKEWVAAKAEELESDGPAKLLGVGGGKVEWVAAKAEALEADGAKLLGIGGGKEVAAPSGLPRPPAGFVAPTHVLLGNAGFRNPLQAWATRPGWLAVEGRAYGLGDLEVTRKRLTLTATSTDGATVFDKLVLEKPAWWKPPAVVDVGRWYDSLPAAPLPDKPIDPEFFATLATLLAAAAAQDPDLLQHYLPGTPAFQLAHRPLSGPAGEAWPPQDVWTAAAPAIKFSTAAGTGPLAGANYLYNLVKGPQAPGRLYYGNGTMTGVAGPTGLPV